MREVNDNPVDPLGSIGSPIRPSAPAQPDQVKAFEQMPDRHLINDPNAALEAICESLRKKEFGRVIPVVHQDDGED